MGHSEIHRKIFYHPKTLKIIGMSDGEESLSKFPYVEVENPLHSTCALRIVKDSNGKPIVLLKKKKQPDFVDKKKLSWDEDMEVAYDPKTKEVYDNKTGEMSKTELWDEETKKKSEKVPEKAKV